MYTFLLEPSVFTTLLVPHQLFLTNTFISGAALPLVPKAFGIRTSAVASLSTPQA